MNDDYLPEVSFGERLVPGSGEVREFWDAQGRPVRDRLPGWPPPPPVRSTRRAVRLRRIAEGLGDFVVEMVSPQPTRPASQQEPDELTEGARLVVFQGEPDSVAAGVPWQLDPAVRPRGTTVRANAENRALLLALSTGETWRAGPEQIARAEQRDHGADHPGLKVTFVDGSWIRLDSSLWQDLVRLADRVGPR